MKNRGVCRKCRSKDIVRIDGKLEGGTVIYLGMVDSVALTRFLCGNCGFTEEWLEGDELIDKVKRRYQSRFRTDLPKTVEDKSDPKSRWERLNPDKI